MLKEKSSVWNIVMAGIWLRILELSEVHGTSKGGFNRNLKNSLDSFSFGDSPSAITLDLDFMGGWQRLREAEKSGKDRKNSFYKRGEDGEQGSVSCHGGWENNLESH